MHSPSFIAATPLDPPLLPPPQSINASPKSALLVENDESLLRYIKDRLEKEGYAIRIASNTEEGLRLYRDCGPFNVVLLNYYAPPQNGVETNCLAPQTHGIGLAMTIREINPSQGIIILALDYMNAREVSRPKELMNIPLLVDVGNSQLRSVLEKIEVDRAVNALTPSDLKRLQRFAKCLVLRLGGVARCWDWEDLLGQALLSTLIGAEDTQQGRHWNKRVSFVRHLAGAMRSTASFWKRQSKKSEGHLIRKFPICDAEGREHSPLDNVPSGYVGADERLIEKDKEERVLARFNDDSQSTQVLQGLLDGLKKIEIMTRYGLDEKKYAAAEKRIRVKLLGRRNHGGQKYDR